MLNILLKTSFLFVLFQIKTSLLWSPHFKYSGKVPPDLSINQMGGGFAGMPRWGVRITGKLGQATFLYKKAFNPCKNEVSAKAAAAVKPPLEEEATPLKAKGGKGAGGGGGRHRETFFYRTLFSVNFSGFRPLLKKKQIGDD